jgi:hypothetical protein
MRWTTAGVAGLCLALSGCGASVSLSSTDGGADSGADAGDVTDAPILVDRPPSMDVPIRPDSGPPPACVLPGGGLCPVGASCPAGDGCNTCTCGPGGLLGCTARFCPMDAGAAPCRSSTDCPSGQLCDGAPGCGTAWSCRPQTEPCTRDLATWCGCDGVDFQASSTCPGRPYLHPGTCATSTASCALPSGARCPVGMTCPAGDGCNDCTCAAAGMLRCTARPCAFDAGPPRPQCASTLDCPAGEECAGPAGCATPWTCRPATGRLCTDDAAPWCGCDGRTFYGSSTCPPQRYASRGACAGPDASVGPSFDCDPQHVECGGIPETCPPGQVHAVSAGCWGLCVDFAGCGTIACDPAVSRLQCPPGALCSATTRTCQLATR